MGGNVFKHTHDMTRLDAEKYEEVCQYFLHSVFSGFNCLIIASYHSKESFGDLDLIVIAEPIAIIKELEYHGYDFSKNGNVISLAYPLEHGLYFQVDVICVDTYEELCSCANYYAYNDLGNLIGRLYHSIGLKYGHDGVTLVERDGDKVLFEMSLCQDMQKILQGVGLDYDTWVRGFDTLEDIFAYVKSSIYFHPSIYLLENRNNTARVRDRKRPTYTAFLQHISETCSDYPEYAKPNKLALKPFLLKYFGKQAEFQACMHQALNKKALSAKFNGHIVSDLTGYEGKELGECMAKIRHIFSEGILLAMSPDTIKSVIVDLKEKDVI